ncbi:uncharacterized protein LOC112488732 isoform X2 [Cynoglossus semilaevis]|uniref:Uncharacterized LOC112488732 n=1 Tax=Cynoglossus semilaevis TaxID=244447 RepID=A0A3P8W230_CYNSE|nr:uncharacterized protein LOC112488732 isoform X2 [Cynoglossus semilaevis]
MKTLLLASVLFAGLFDSLAAVPVPPGPVPAPLPYHAFCRTMWLFASPCINVSTAVLKQIQAFNPVNKCILCHYRLVGITNNSVIANHTSADGLQAESLTFTFSSTVMAGGCRVTALSASLGFTNLFDGGLNYCNLYNILSASGLMSSPGFAEITNEWACLGYGEAPCHDV